MTFIRLPKFWFCQLYLVDVVNFLDEDLSFRNPPFLSLNSATCDFIQGTSLVVRMLEDALHILQSKADRSSGRSHPTEYRFRWQVAGGSFDSRHRTNPFQHRSRPRSDPLGPMKEKLMDKNHVFREHLGTPLQFDSDVRNHRFWA
jgi:hypothetical protein